MKKVISLLMILVLALGLFVACGEGDSTDSSISGADSSVNVDGLINTADVNFVENGESVYRIIRPDGDTEMFNVAKYLFKEMKNKLGVDVRNMADSTADDDSYEILLGLTNREASKQALAYLEGKSGGRYNDFVICTIGKKICIYAYSVATMQEAAEYFFNNYVVANGVKGGIAYIRETEGNFESIKINGVEAGKFDFVRPHYNSSWLTECEMEKIIETVHNKTGFMMNINHDTYTEPSEYEIIVGDTTREGVEKITDRDQFKITVKGKKVYINGGSAHATAMGVSEFAKLLTGDVTDAASVTGSYEAAMASYDKSTTYHRVWGDDFDGTEVDTTKWWQCKGFEFQSKGQNGKVSLRSDNPNHVYVQDGKITMCAAEDDNYYYGGMIRSEGIMKYKYGYAEISALLPQGDSFWTAWWTWCDDTESSIYPGQPALCRPEIDINEMFGNSAVVHPNAHSHPTEEGKKAGLEHTSLDKISGKNYKCPDNGVKFSDGFHTYGFLWEENKLTFTADGNVYYSYDTNTNEQDLETFSHNMFFIISLATAFDNQTPVTTNPDEWQNSNKYSVDWINLYQKDDGVHSITHNYKLRK